MTWSSWILFVLTEAALSASPGPAVLLVLSQGLRTGPPGALWSAGGVLVVNGLFFVISGTSLGVLLISSERLFAMMKWAGAAYLLYLGLKALLGPAPPAMRTEGGDAHAASAALFLRGAVTQLANPKALLYFVAILPQFIDRRSPVLAQLTILGITSIVLEFTILAAYGGLAAGAARTLARRRFAAVTSRISGALLIGAALGVARLER